MNIFQELPLHFRYPCNMKKTPYSIAELWPQRECRHCHADTFHEYEKCFPDDSWSNYFVFVANRNFCLNISTNHKMRLFRYRSFSNLAQKFLTATKIILLKGLNLLEHFCTLIRSIPSHETDSRVSRSACTFSSLLKCTQIKPKLGKINTNSQILT